MMPVKADPAICTVALSAMVCLNSAIAKVWLSCQANNWISVLALSIGYVWFLQIQSQLTIRPMKLD